MKNKFILKISNPDGTNEIVTLDLNDSIRRQMHPIAARRAEVRHAYMELYVSETKDYNAMQVCMIAHMLNKDKSKSFEWNAVLDTPQTADINAHLILSPNYDRAILELFYLATGGDGWVDNTNWLSNRPLCDWYGIRTNDEGRVREVKLPRNNLRGKIPASLFDLEFLKSLDLSRNSLSKSIPHEIVQCWMLQEIKLCYNRLSGAIPEEIWTLTDLRNLDLGYNALTSPIPDAVGNLVKLQHLCLNDNTIGGTVPDSICRLTKLKWLRLKNCSLTGELPASMGDLHALTLLHLSDNDFTGGLPESLKEIPGLKKPTV